MLLDVLLLAGGGVAGYLIRMAQSALAAKVQAVETSVATTAANLAQEAAKIVPDIKNPQHR
jgi:hypothetical protein